MGAGSGEMDGGSAGEFCDRPASASRLRAGGGQRAGKEEAGEGAVDGAARADAFDDLLAEVAALGKVQGAGLAPMGAVSCGRSLSRMSMP